MKSLDDIETLLGAMRDRGAEMKAFEGLLMEIGAAMAEIVECMNKPKPADDSMVRALTEGLAKLKAPQVTVNVEPTPVQVMGQSDWSTLKITTGWSSSGAKEFTITKG